mmetsp:Transcript_58870/g.124847  ORF Transcript_58870/g.124847 Transcript_58870/m.124847 type:complete len:550 (+) Transcript_58870:26-1675(+)|eukprot:CAMPEP_0206452010 /NCGR_PEP_ID=MMETSP0324_2-20121206/19686_1 /ASSEMBLY_ACC=CAM_ASM_000836 /TAXON_ID=2866 /ORGANISM="Crypthecodinium cohnii, Strain Seligo" /LENGTH=549 /DNA_ID=CAMNT_0053922009 /DNA_START=26 /DNA_END=1675 /DNA_ORIENTATION=-
MSGDPIQKLLAKLEQPGVAWTLVAVGVIILVKLKLVLFACALPLVVYWRLSQAANSPEESADQDPASPTENAGQSQWNVGGEDNDDLGSEAPSGGPPSDGDDDIFGDDVPAAGKKGSDSPDPYDSSFWGDSATGGSAPAAAPAPTASAPKDSFDLRQKGSWGAAADEDDELAVPLPADTLSEPDPLAEFAAPKEDNILEGLLSSGIGGGGSGGPDFGLASMGFGGRDDDDFPSLGGPSFMEDDDHFGGGFGGGGGKGGKGKGKGKKGEGKGKDGPREADPKQLFVANVGDLSQSELRSYFEEVGEVTRLKVLEKEDGSSKGVCFVTFATEDQARDALRLHGRQLGDRNLVVRLAQAGGKGEKGEKGGGKHHDKGDRDRDFDRDRDRRGEDREMFSDRFGSAFGDRGDRGDSRGGKGKGGRGKGGHRHDPFREVEQMIQNVLDEGDGGTLQLSDFDFSKKFLLEIHNRDKADGTDRFTEAMDLVLKYAGSKDRSSVRKWPAYVLTLLTRFDPDLAEELRREGKGDGRHKGGGKGHKDRDRDFGGRDDRDD